MLDITRIDRGQLDRLDAAELRELAAALLERAGRDAHEIGWRDAKIDKLTFEVAQLRRLSYGVKSEQMTAGQRALFEESAATSPPSKSRSPRCEGRCHQRPTARSNSPSGRHFPRGCLASIGTTNPRARSAAAAARCESSRALPSRLAC